MANEIAVFPVTARRKGPSAEDLGRAQVFYVPRIDGLSAGKDGGATIRTGGERAALKVETYESRLDIMTAQLGAAASANPFTSANYGAVSAAGSNLSGATQLGRYLNVVSAATADSADGVKLPSPSSRNVLVLINGTSVPVEVFPHGASAFIDSGASGASKTLPAYGRLHFYTDPDAGASGVWRTAEDNG